MGLSADDGVCARLSRGERDWLVPLSEQQLAELRNVSISRPKVTSALELQAKAVIALLDERGAWVEDGQLRYHGKADDTRRVIDSRTFIRNVETLSRYLAVTRRNQSQRAALVAVVMLTLLSSTTSADSQIFQQIQNFFLSQRVEQPNRHR